MAEHSHTPLRSSLSLRRTPSALRLLKSLHLRRQLQELGYSFRPTRVRADYWVELRELIRPLQELRKGETPDTAKLRTIKHAIEKLLQVERLWAFPGVANLRCFVDLFDGEEYERFANAMEKVAHVVISEAYRHIGNVNLEREVESVLASPSHQARRDQPPLHAHDKEIHQRFGAGGYFEVLVVGHSVIPHHRTVPSPDYFHYEMLEVESFAEAVCAVLFNPIIQAVIIREDFRHKTDEEFISADVGRILRNSQPSMQDEMEGMGQQEAMTLLLASVLADIRPELDIYNVTDLSIEKVALVHKSAFRRIFYNAQGDMQELHLSIIEGVKRRFEAPFFMALNQYALHPTGVFHALPISRASSLTHSFWARDMLAFYGPNIFLAETSATIGGLDSLLEPIGAIKKGQELAAETFGSNYTYWVTNGTSTANKIVVQALVRPGDIVLVDRNCHNSQNLGLSLVGASVVYLEPYPLHKYIMFGAIPLHTIKKTLLEYKDAGTLHKVKMLMLTNCTFDGIVYNVKRVLEECLAIKPDLIFFWDEAWWGFARFHYLLRERTAMWTAQQLLERYASPDYKEEYSRWRKKHTSKHNDEEVEFDLEDRWLPDPEKVRIRVYATQSIHKTLTALRQGSMIHVRDQDFKRLAEKPFRQSYYTHTSTSPNYQILASLDVGRRQVALEGFELVQKHLHEALVIRKDVAGNPDLAHFFTILDVEDIIPAKYRHSGMECYSCVTETEEAWHKMDVAWAEDEFVLDPNRLTLYTGEAGIDGNTFKKNLMDTYDIQVNKTSIKTVLFLLTIGSSRSSVAYLLESLTKIAEGFRTGLEDMSTTQLGLHKKRILDLTKHQPPLPNFSYFHPAFRACKKTPEGLLREGFFAAYEEDDCTYIPLDDKQLDEENPDNPLVAASFVVPYPPGFPILVPGQVVSADIVHFFRHLDVHEIHGYSPPQGLRVFKPHVMKRRLEKRAREEVDNEGGETFGL